MRFEWDEQKNRQNLRKHDVRFETAVLVFDDPYAPTQRDFTSEDEERWITVGAIGPVRFYWSCILSMRNKAKKSSVSFRRVLLSRMKGGPMRKLTKEQKRDIRTIAAKRDEDIDLSDVPPVLDFGCAPIENWGHVGKINVLVSFCGDGPDVSLLFLRELPYRPSFHGTQQHAPK